MISSDFLENYYSDEISNIVDEENSLVEQQVHESLIQNLSKKFDQKKPSQKQWKSTRLEASDQLKNYEMSKNFKSKLSLDKLLKFTENGPVKKLKNFQNKTILLNQFHKQLANRFSRQVIFKDLEQGISKYDSVVKETRNADQIIFPAEQNEKLSMDITEILISSSNLEKIQEIQDQIVENKKIVYDDKFFIDNKIHLLKSVDLEEAKKLHKEIQRRRVLQSYQEAKYRRIRRIKSKEYHRHLKKDRLRNAVENFENFFSENSMKALEKLKELDRLRAMERASLKHKNSGKWARYQKIRAKYNERARADLNEQLQMNQTLMKKRNASFDFDSFPKMIDGTSLVKMEQFNQLVEQNLNNEKNIIEDQMQNLDPNKFLTPKFQMELCSDDENENEYINFHGNPELMEHLRAAFPYEDIENLVPKDKIEPECSIGPLPGWGHWSETKPKRQKSRKHTNLPKRKLEILNQPLDEKASVPLPIGSTWTPQSITKCLIQPKIITNSGSIIEPMNKL